MNKIILLGNMTRNPKTTRKTAEDGSEVVITKFDLAVNRRSKRDGEADADLSLDGCRITTIRPKREARSMVSASLQKRLNSHRRKVRRNRQIKTVIFHPFRMRSNRSMAGR